MEKTVTLYREIDALGGAATDEWGRGYGSAIADVLTILHGRGFTEREDPLIGMTLNRDNLRTYLGEAQRLAKDANASRVEMVVKLERMRRMVSAVAEGETPLIEKPLWQHVAYFDEGAFHWMSGIAPRDCELYAKATQP